VIHSSTCGLPRSARSFGTTNSSNWSASFAKHVDQKHRISEVFLEHRIRQVVTTEHTVSPLQ
jgi:hypothetical protein